MASGAPIHIWNRALARIGSEKIESTVGDHPAAEAFRDLYDNMLQEVLEARRWRWPRRQRPLSSLDSQSYDWPGDGATVVFQIPFGFLETTQVTVAHVVGGTATTLTPTTQYTFNISTVSGVPSTVTLIGVVPGVGESLRVTVTVEREGWEHLYRLPTDCVTPIALLGEDQRIELTPERERDAWELMIDDTGEGLMLATDVDPANVEALEFIAFITHVRAMPALFQKALVTRCAAELALVLKKKPAEATYWRKQYELDLGYAFAKNSNNRQPGAPPPTPSLVARGGRTSSWHRRRR